MIIFIDKKIKQLLESKDFSRLEKDHKKHVLPEPDAMRDFRKQSSWVGADGSGYPMFPNMSQEEYEARAKALRDANIENSYINYIPSGSEGRRARALKWRKVDLPPTRFNNEFAELVTYSITDNAIIAYYLCTYPDRINELMADVVYDFDGRPYLKNKDLLSKLQDDEYTLNQIQDFLKQHNKSIQDNQDDTDESLDESYSMPQQITDRFGRIIGFISSDNNTGEQMLTDRFGKVKGWYNSRTNMTTDRFGRVVGFGNILTTLLNND